MTPNEFADRFCRGEHGCRWHGPESIYVDTASFGPCPLAAAFEREIEARAWIIENMTLVDIATKREIPEIVIAALNKARRQFASAIRTRSSRGDEASKEDKRE